MCFRGSRLKLENLKKNQNSGLGTSDPSGQKLVQGQKMFSQKNFGKKKLSDPPGPAGEVWQCIFHTFPAGPGRSEKYTVRPSLLVLGHEGWKNKTRLKRMKYHQQEGGRALGFDQ